MIYVCSDIHGYYGRFRLLLKKIEFSDNDELYILGDAIDRGSQGIRLLQYINKYPNIHMIMGNHEHMMLSYIKKTPEYYFPYNDIRMMQLWFKNGGMHTQENFMALDQEDKRIIVEMLESLPYEESVSVNGKDFRLVHAYPAIRENYSDEDEYKNALIWERPERGQPFNLPDNQIVLLGHTPVYHMTQSLPMEVAEISKNVYDIDCGMAGSTKNRRMACIRLDDMEVFYN